MEQTRTAHICRCGSEPSNVELVIHIMSQWEGDNSSLGQCRCCDAKSRVEKGLVYASFLSCLMPHGEKEKKGRREEKSRFDLMSVCNMKQDIASKQCWLFITPFWGSQSLVVTASEEIETESSGAAPTQLMVTCGNYTQVILSCICAVAPERGPPAVLI